MIKNLNLLRIIRKNIKLNEFLDSIRYVEIMALKNQQNINKYLLCFSRMEKVKSNLKYLIINSLFNYRIV